MEQCEAKIRPFRGVNETELRCALGATPHDKHQATLTDYAYKGSSTEMSWLDTDRRTFRGEFTTCDQSTCILPAGHSGNHAK